MLPTAVLKIPASAKTLGGHRLSGRRRGEGYRTHGEDTQALFHGGSLNISFGKNTS